MDIDYAETLDGDYVVSIANARSEDKVRRITNLAWYAFRNGNEINAHDLDELKSEMGEVSAHAKNYKFIVDDSKTLYEARSLAILLWYKEIRITISSMKELIDAVDGDEEFFETDELSSDFKVISNKFYRRLREIVGCYAGVLVVNDARDVFEVSWKERESQRNMIHVKKIKTFKAEEFDCI